MKDKILIPEWLKKEVPVYAEFCAVINEELKGNPNLSLAEFAERINNLTIEIAYNRIKAAVNAQFNTVDK